VGFITLKHQLFIATKEGIKMRKYTVTMIIIALMCYFSIAPLATAASDEEEILQVETNFMKAVSTGDLSLMSSLYSHSSKTTQFPPGSPSLLIQGWEESFEKYWKYTISPSTGTTTMIFHHPQVTMLKDDVAVITGYESIVNTNASTQEQTTTIYRLTRIVQKIKGKWLIVHDHASAIPAE
jgi:ketosteroid isomerase-like protein